MPPLPITTTITITKVLISATTLRLLLLIYGTWQDTHSALKYTDIDYAVFTDAARYVARGESPYARATYRYTPLLAWLLYPTSWAEGASASGLGVGLGTETIWFSFGKILFSLSDILAGWLVYRLLVEGSGGHGHGRQMNPPKALCYVSGAWLLNPMVANISTRGSSEGLLGVLVSGLLWAVLSGWVGLAGFLLGLGVHFKIYPFVYGVSVFWWLDGSQVEKDEKDEKDEKGEGEDKKAINAQKPKPILSLCLMMLEVKRLLTPNRLRFTITALSTFFALNVAMYAIYDTPFLQHTYLHHLSRVDHRHNFSPYSTLLYLSAARGGGAGGDGGAGGAGGPRGGATGIPFESLAFIPQLLLSVLAIPLVLARKDLPGAMLAQTFAFVAFNKVCTSQYFLWYLIFLPFYLPNSSLIRRPRLGVAVAVLWVVAQALWLHQAYNLEFLGQSTFVPGLFLASLFFFGVNVWILGIVVRDVGGSCGSFSSNSSGGMRSTSTSSLEVEGK